MKTTRKKVHGDFFVDVVVGLIVVDACTCMIVYLSLCIMPSPGQPSVLEKLRLQPTCALTRQSIDGINARRAELIQCSCDICD